MPELNQFFGQCLLLQGKLIKQARTCALDVLNCRHDAVVQRRLVKIGGDGNRLRSRSAFESRAEHDFVCMNHADKRP
jgi:hypothetical protein